METTQENIQGGSILNTWFRFASIAFWYVLMIFAAYHGLFIHAFLGFAATTILVYLVIKQGRARNAHYRNQRLKRLSNYHIGEDYLKVFDSRSQRKD